jgi:chemotaxis protein CheZ
MNPALSQPRLNCTRWERREQMPVQRKIFRIEQAVPHHDAATLLQSTGISAAERQEILDALQARFDAIESRNAEASQATARVEPDDLGKLRMESEAIHRALSRLKQEIIAVHIHAFAPSPARITRELDAVVESTERATQQILSAAEIIDDAANTLSASLKSTQEQALALDIRDNAQRIFEACNFQDLTGQRIAKILATVKFVEARVAQMVEICGGSEALAAHVANPNKPIDRGQILRGPKLEGDDGHATQDDVDAIFATD